MTAETSWHPDLLRRFVATPYVFCSGSGKKQLCIQSNDLGVALSIRRSCITQRFKSGSDVLIWKLIRDSAAPGDDAQILTISDGVLRTLHLGTGTVLIYDHERAEVLGFISATVKTEQLASSLIPLLLGL
jgi:hypothetical protein